MADMLKKLFMALLFILLPLLAFAHSWRTDSSWGHTCRTNCSSYGYHTGQYHYHGGWSTYTPNHYTKPKPTCQSEYGVFSYEGSDGYCYCSSWYVFGKNLTWEKYCVSQNSYCTTNHWYLAKYSTTQKSCVCREGYTVDSETNKCLLKTAENTCLDSVNWYLWTNGSCYCNEWYDWSESENKCVKTKIDYSYCKEPWYFTISRVVDWDTLEYSCWGEEYKVRIIWIDTPETKHPSKGKECYWPEATQKMKSLVEGKTVYLSWDIFSSNQDRYWRVLRYVGVDGKDIWKEMISLGYASAYLDFQFSRESAYEKAEDKAKDLGLWKWVTCGLKMTKKEERIYNAVEDLINEWEMDEIFRLKLISYISARESNFTDKFKVEVFKLLEK